MLGENLCGGVTPSAGWHRKRCRFTPEPYVPASTTLEPGCVGHAGTSWALLPNGRPRLAFTPRISASPPRTLGPLNHTGGTGQKVEYRSIPYHVVTNFSVETAGTFDLDAEMKIWISGNPIPISKEFNKKVNVYEVQQILAQYVCT